LHWIARSSSAADHGYLGAFNVVATVGLFAVIAALVPIVLRIRGQRVDSLWWVDRAPSWSLGALLVVGLACVAFAYAALY
jgi:hypothetical protein